MKNSVVKYPWKKTGIPHTGWKCIKEYDHGSATFKCEMCDNPRVRKVSVMEHPDYDGQIKVGSDCAEIMYFPGRDGLRFPTRKLLMIVHDESKKRYWIGMGGTNEFQGKFFDTREEAIDFVIEENLILKAMDD